MEEFQQNYKDYDMSSIFRWYSRETVLYKTLNNCLKIANSDSIQYCRLVLRDLEIAI